MTEKERLELAQWAMERTLKSGADEVAVVMYNSREIEIEFRDTRLEKIKESVTNGLSFDIYADHRYSSHSTSDLRRHGLERFIGEAVASTRYLGEDEYRSLPDPKYYPEKLDTELEILDETYDGLESSERVRFAADIEKAAAAESERIITRTAWYEDSRTDSVRIHSNGLVGHRRSTRFGAGAEVTVRGEGEGRPSDWAWAETRFGSDLPAPEALGHEAAERAHRKIGQAKGESGTYDMLVENRVCQRLLRMFAQPLSAQALQQKRSYLEGMVGQRIASEKFTVIDDPLLKRGLSSRLYDGDGLGARRMVLVEGGMLRQYYIDDYYGKKLGMEPTAGSPSNVVFELGTKSLEEMVKDIKRGILVNDFIGGNSNPTTGDFSYGILGLLIENGAVTRPVNEMNISGNAMDLWAGLVAVGNDPDPYDSVRSPSMLFEGVHFSGT